MIWGRDVVSVCFVSVDLYQARFVIFNKIPLILKKKSIYIVMHDCLDSLYSG